MREPGGQNDQKQEATSASTVVSLQGIAAFANLVELLAHALNTVPGKIHGNIPQGPGAFDELFAEIDYNGDNFVRRLTLLSKPGAPVTLRVHSARYQARKKDSLVGGVVIDVYPGATVAQLIPQVRLLGREVKAMFEAADRMVELREFGKHLQASNVRTIGDTKVPAQINTVTKAPASKNGPITVPLPVKGAIAFQSTPNGVYN